VVLRRMGTQRARELLQTVVPRAIEDPLDFIRSGEMPADELIDRERGAALLRSALGEFSPADRRLFEGRMLDERSYDDLSKELGSTPGALRKRFHDLCQRLVAQLRLGEPEPPT